MKVFGVPIVPLVALFAAGAVFAQSQSGAQLLSGGVGHDERERMMQRYRDYNLHLAFAEPGGSYLAGVAVTARDETGKVVLATVSEGPFLFAAVPPGAYQITADLGGEARTRAIRVGAEAGPIHYFRWGAAADPAASSAPPR